MLDALQQLDQHLLLYLNGLHTPFWDHFMWIFSGKWVWIPMYATFLYILYRNFNFKLALFTTLAIVLTIVYADQVCASIIRPLVERMRPSNPNNPLSEFVHILHNKRGGRYGFPSCHASNSFALGFFVVLFFRQRFLSCFILSWAVVNSYSRIYLGVHYPGDLLAGMLVGLSGALLIYYFYRYALRRPSFARLVGYEAYRKLIEHPREIKCTQTTVYIGSATIAGILFYAAIA